MDKRMLIGLGIVAVVAAAGALLALGPVDAGDPVGERARVEAAPQEAAPAPEAAPSDFTARPAPTPGTDPAADAARAMLEAMAKADPSTVSTGDAQEALRLVGVHLQSARVALPDDAEGAAAVLERAVDELAAVQKELAEGNLSPSDAKQRALQIRLDAAVGFDGAAEPAEAKALKEALGFDMSGSDDLGWGVPLTEENFGLIFGEEGGALE